MNNLELVIQTKHIISEVKGDGTNIDKPHKAVIDFDVASYSLSDSIDASALRKPNNKLLAFGKMAEFTLDNLNEDDYILVKGDIEEISEEENILVPKSIKILGGKKKNLQFVSKSK